MYVPLVRLQMVKEKSLQYGAETMENPAKVAGFVRKLLGGADREKLVVIPVDTKCRPVAIEIAAIGRGNCVEADPKDILKIAILNNATGIIVAHNHLSGDVTPSKEDCMFTQRIREASELLGIEVLDHIIIGDGEEFLSMKEKMWFDYE